MGDKRGEVPLIDARNNLIGVLADFRVLRDSLMENVPNHDDIPYLLAREAMFERTVQKAMGDIEYIIGSINEGLEGGEPSISAEDREQLNEIFAEA